MSNMPTHGYHSYKWNVAWLHRKVHLRGDSNRVLSNWKCFANCVGFGMTLHRCWPFMQVYPITDVLVLSVCRQCCLVQDTPLLFLSTKYENHHTQAFVVVFFSCLKLFPEVFCLVNQGFWNFFHRLISPELMIFHHKFEN